MIVTKQLHDAIKIPHTVPTVLPFHTFTYSLLTLTMVREICRRNASRVLYNVISSSWFPGFPKENQSNFPYPYPIPPPLPDNRIKIAYVSSDFTNHPLAHLMQSVFGFHNRQKFVIYCYALSPSDNSQYRQTIERSCDVFVDVSSWSIQQIVEHISYVEQIHILINLNGYTKGARNEIFAARPCPIQMSLMGYAGTLDKRWIDYLIADEIVCPQKFVCGEPVEDETECDELLRGPVRRNNDSNRIYTEALLYLPETYFCNDHRQGFREPLNPAIEHLLDQLDLSNDIHSAHYQLERHWNREQLMRMDMRKQLFPHLLPDTLILANFNQLYKIDPQIFDCWLSILRQIPNAVLWLLRFPPLGESHLKSRALKFGHDVANRVIFTVDVAPKHIHIYRGRVADLFLDTPECNAHTTAADILWSGTPLITYPKYDFKMSSRVAASCAYSTGTLRDPNLLGHWMVAKSYNDYVSKAVFLLKSCYHPSKDVLSHIYVQHGLLNDLRKRLFLNRDTSPLFDTPRYVKHLENGYQMAYEKWQRGFKAFKQGVRLSGYPTVSRCLKVPSIQY
ncbi:glycosyl transferase family 41-domain-containing protein [Gorgonomyces haynaldii]|nr:glycosyl transferase family 41-domain-containing protein [Gorgonomyces haynaldii]